MPKFLTSKSIFVIRTNAVDVQKWWKMKCRVNGTVQGNKGINWILQVGEFCGVQPEMTILHWYHKKVLGSVEGTLVSCKPWFSASESEFFITWYCAALWSNTSSSGLLFSLSDDEDSSSSSSSLLFSDSLLLLQSDSRNGAELLLLLFSPNWQSSKSRFLVPCPSESSWL